MALIITHSTVASDPQTPLLDDGDWNAEHTIVGLDDLLNAKADITTVVLKSDYSPSHSIIVQQSGTGSPTALQVGNNTILGRLTGGGSDIDDLTGTQVTTLLDVFTTSLKGVVPASGGGTTNFLRADGTWATPSAGSSIISGSAIVDFGSYGYATKVSVVDALVTVTSKIIVSPASPAVGRDDDELEFNPICVGVVPKDGIGFDIYATAPIGADGQFNVNYMIGAY
jgi:hypothetical protein